MKPVDKGRTVTGLKAHGDAKPELIHRLGQFCSYCESEDVAQAIDVEHIYPQKPHPDKGRNWRNFLLACSSCNTFKAHYLGNGRQSAMLSRFLWPHVDNTFNAFHYHPDGRVDVRSGLPADVMQAAEGLRDMVGLMRSPAVARKFHDLGIAYDGTEKRKQAWEIARACRDAYEENPGSAKQLKTVVLSCVTTGHFSVWMAVFANHPEVLKEFVKACKAASNCFDPQDAAPRKRGRV